MTAVPSEHELIVFGLPGPQGSKSFKGISKSGRAIMVESSKKVKPWREAIEWAVHSYLDGWRSVAAWTPIDYPLTVEMVFTVPLPKSAPKTRRTVPATMPDLSKYCRATEDALKTSGMIKDDGLIQRYTNLAKVYPLEDPMALESPGTRIILRPSLEEPLHPSLICPGCGGFAPRHKCGNPHWNRQQDSLPI